jgi:HK97 family phage portal protein
MMKLTIRNVIAARLAGISRKELRAMMFNGQDLTTIFGNGLSSSGVQVSDQSALSQSSVLSALRLISEVIASFPLRTYKVAEDDSRQIDKEHALFSMLLNSPNEEMTAFTFIQTLIIHMFLYGGGYIRIIWKRAQVAGLEILYPPATVQYDGYYMTWIRTSPMSAGEMVKLFPYEIIKIPFMLPFNDFFKGKGLLSLAEDPIGLALAIDQYAASYFRNGAAMGGLLESDKQIPDDVKRRILAQFSVDNVGVGNAFNIGIVPTGVKFSKITNNPQESQSVEQREFQVHETARIFRIPAHFLDSKDKSSKASLEDMNQEFLDYGILPIARKIEQAIAQKCFIGDERRTHFVQFDFGELLRPNFLALQQSYAIMRQNGIINGQEWRRAVNMNPVDDPTLNAYLVLSNMGGIGYQGKASDIQGQGEPPVSEPDSADERSIPAFFGPIIEEIAKKALKREQIEREKAEKRGESKPELVDPRPLAESLFASMLTRRGRIHELDARLLRFKDAYSASFSSKTGHKEPEEIAQIVRNTLLEEVV